MGYKLLRFVKSIISKRIFLSLKIIFVSLFKNNSFSLYGIDLEIDKIINKSDGYFVELGANDGVTQSNTLRLERSKNWNGLLIEPYPENYMYCAHFRGNKNRVVSAACVDFEYNEKFVELEYSNLTTSQVLDTTSAERDQKRDYLQNHEDFVTFGARAYTLSAILLKAEAPRLIDFMSLDVEGAELGVLRGIDFSIHNFRFILVETSNFQSVESLLNQHKYSFIKKLTFHDYLFKLVDES